MYSCARRAEQVDRGAGEVRKTRIANTAYRGDVSVADG